ncbi:MAG: hypothetical protein ACQEP1_04185 [Nanobdellota archaeon]
MNKKAVFFTFIAILVMTVLVGTFQYRSYLTNVNRVPVIESRMGAVSDYVGDIEEVHVKRALHVAGKRGMEHYINEISADGEFDNASEFQSHMEELVINGTYGNDDVYNLSLVKVFGNFTDWSDDILRVNTTFDFYDLEVYQSERTGPWGFAVNVSYEAFVDADYANWTIDDEVRTEILIPGYRDLYLNLNTGGLNRTIWKAANQTWLVGESLDDEYEDHFIGHVEHGTYIYDKESPSYMNRLVNDTSSSDCCGIHSFANSSQYFNMTTGSQGGFYNNSFVDFCYFNETSEGCDEDLWLLEEFSSDYDTGQGNNDTYPFRIDDYHFEVYNLTDLDNSEYRYS